MAHTYNLIIQKAEIEMQPPGSPQLRKTLKSGKIKQNKTKNTKKNQKKRNKTKQNKPPPPVTTKNSIAKTTLNKKRTDGDLPISNFMLYLGAVAIKIT